ncbi:acyl carrier protein [Caldimonas brevitalea]|uniref:Polyketide-8 synthase acyl carrier protein n=1 Tax=Caldimonas brevitalea TaxID=413882 RepID=A0A0G3BKV2_9BURK|nr:acyl carrier protein [Caldimonas brevitalea]AKJ30084.1 polyketide-8 synthase acyl carrier protein [Caldimonas brevitalea]
MNLTESQRSKIHEIIADALEISPEELKPTLRFKEDYDADSLLAIDILATLEKTFKISIPQSELNRMVSLEAVYAVVLDAQPQVA